MSDKNSPDVSVRAVERDGLFFDFAIDDIITAWRGRGSRAAFFRLGLWAVLRVELLAEGIEGLLNFFGQLLGLFKVVALQGLFKFSNF